MERKIELKNTEIKYTYKRLRRAKGMTITVRPDSSVLVTTPISFPVWFMEKSLQKQADWILKKIVYFQTTKDYTLTSIGGYEYKRYKEKARQFIKAKVEGLNQVYAFQYSRISIRNQGTIWGSCSQEGNLNFNYKLYFLPNHLAEYIIAHELCHLKELNHSKEFWQLVAKTIPDYKPRIKELKARF